MKVLRITIKAIIFSMRIVFFVFVAVGPFRCPISLNFAKL